MPWCRVGWLGWAGFSSKQWLLLFYFHLPESLSQDPAVSTIHTAYSEPEVHKALLFPPLWDLVLGRTRSCSSCRREKSEVLRG